MKKSEKIAEPINKEQLTTLINITIPPLQRKIFLLTLVGDSPLICHKFSKKVQTMMVQKQKKMPQEAKKAKDPEQDYKDSLYEMSDQKYGFPAMAFKKSAVNACSLISGITKVQARSAFFVVNNDGNSEGEEQELVEIKGKPSMRQDPVKIQMTNDIRFRGQFKEWSCVLRIQYNVNIITPEQIAHLFNYAGDGIGVGEWRPNRDGQYGRFHVK